MVSLVQAHAHGVNWELWIALITPTLTVVATIGRALNRKLLAVQDKLENQDKAKLAFEQTMTAQHRDLGERVSRLEGPVQRTEQAVKA